MSNEHDHGHDHGHHEHELPWIRKYVFSTDHKVIGIQYGVTALLFLAFGFFLMMVMRWQLAYPDTAVPFIGWLIKWLADLNGFASDGNLPSDLYNVFGAMHGTIMIFLGVVPMVVGAFGNYIVPLQIGAPDMAFPKLNMTSYWVYFVGGIIMLVSFFLPGGAANSGWTSYPPLSDIATTAFTGSQFTASGATYDAATGDMVLTIGSHTLTTSDTVRIDPYGLTFTCGMDGNTARTFIPSGTDWTFSFWYKANEHDNFKIGAQEYWDYAEQNGGDTRDEPQYGGYKNQYVVDKKY